MRDLADLTAALSGPKRGTIKAGIRVSGVTADSRKVEPGSVFVCLKGARHDGHAFVQKAVLDGAVAVVVGRPLRCRRQVIRVKDTARALAELSAEFWGHPSRRLDVAGITGTKGKTTTAYMLESILKAAGRKPALFGTIENRYGSARFPHSFTTAQAPDLQSMLANVLERGADSTVMEVSSHALDQLRVEGVGFRAGIFTNLTRDHLDYHRTMARYFEAKARLFSGLPKASLGGIAVVNIDSPSGWRLAGRTAARVVRYSARGSREADISASRGSATLAGTRFVLSEGGTRIPVRLSLIGLYNIANALAAAGAARGLGISLDIVRRGLESVVRVPGRMVPVPIRAPFKAIVDYAHTPDSLEWALKTVRGLARGRVLAVFGCGGNRDRGKRPRMGGIAVRLADFTWVTSDNPRDEEPLSIISEITAGIRANVRYAVEPDRRSAIRAALAAARRGDVVLVAGKGHEQVQIVGGRRLPFDDVRVTRELWTNG
jgi:UDP-N-acetylmuramoyl-L-alanyl-D-glutamate--2,6-diaminopimelate ligase